MKFQAQTVAHAEQMGHDVSNQYIKKKRHK